MKTAGVKIRWFTHSLKGDIEDFIVEEIPFELPEGEDYLTFVLEKVNMTTLEAVEFLSKYVHKPVSYAGTKDKKALTRQTLSLEFFPGAKRKLEKLNHPKMKLYDFKKTSEPIKLGRLHGNKFKIIVRADYDPDILKEIKHQASNGVPNFFGYQRFGTKHPITHLVGREILKRNYEKATRIYLTKSEESKEKIIGNGKYEKILSSHNPEKGLSKLPEGLKKMFIHAYQSYIFNTSLSDYIIKKDLKSLKRQRNFPAIIPGYDTFPGKDEFGKLVNKNMIKDSIKPKDFYFRNFKEFSSPGEIHPAFFYPDISYEKNDKGFTLNFKLKPGQYATVVLSFLD